MTLTLFTALVFFFPNLKKLGGCSNLKKIKSNPAIYTSSTNAQSCKHCSFIYSSVQSSCFMGPTGLTVGQVTDEDSVAN